MASRPHAISPALVLGAAALLGLCLGPAAAAAAGASPRRREAAQVQIELPATPARAGDEVAITLRVLDGQGAPVDASRVELGTLAGTLSPLTRSGEGVHRATFTVPRQLPRAREAVLFASADGLLSERTLHLAPGPAHSVEISGADSVGPRQRRVLTVSIADAFGNGADEEPRARARKGPLTLRRLAETGLWTLEYAPRPDVEGTEDQDEIVVQAGDATGRRAMRLSPGATRLSVAPWLGAALGSPAGLAAGATWSASSILGPDELGLAVDLGWWHLADRRTVSLAGTPAALTHDRTYVPVTALATWGHPLTARLVAGASAGAGVAFVTATERLAGQPAVHEAGFAPAAVLAAELGVRAGLGAAFLQLRGAWAGNAHLSTLSGASSTLLVLGGYRFDAR
jgi:hypothetical protein